MCGLLSQIIQRVWTALRWACKGGHAEVIRVLIQHGASIDQKDKVRLIYRECASMAGIVQTILAVYWHAGEYRYLNH